MRIIFLVALCLVLSGCPRGGDPSPGPGPVNSEPSAQMKELVKAVEPVSAPQISAFYSDFADLVRRDADSKIITTTGDIREVNAKAGVLVFQSDLKGKYPNLATDIDAVFANGLGIQNGEFDRDHAVEVLAALAWALK